MLISSPTNEIQIPIYAFKLNIIVDMRCMVLAFADF